MPKSKAVADAFSYRYLDLISVGGFISLHEALENYVTPYTSILTESSK
jgi:hypothetical protein